MFKCQQNLIIPSVLAGAALLFNAQSTQTQLNITTDNQREAALQTYIDKMSELLLDGKLRTSERGSEIRSVARTRTLSTLRQLDGTRKGQVLQFLHESQLISRTDAVIALEGANLAGANLAGANLAGANLAGANLTEADFTEADFTEADLTEADLTWTSFYSATLNGTTLTEANLSGIALTKANLTGANLTAADLTLATLAAANLSSATLTEANLARADLIGADLTGAVLKGANLEEAFLGGVKVTQEQLAQARSLKDASMPDGSFHP